MENTIKYEDFVQLQQENLYLKSEILKYQQIIINFQKKLFGSNSEHFIDNNQISLLNVPEPEIVESKEVITVKEHSKRKSRKKADLPVVIQELYPESTKCDCCDKEMLQFSKDESDRLEYVPAKIYTKRYIRHKFKCETCNQFKIASLPPEASIIDKSLASASLLANIIVSKYVDHLPLHRQEQIYQRQNIELLRNAGFCFNPS